MISNTGPVLSRAELENRAHSGKSEDIHFLMENLGMNQGFLQCKLIDYALGLVTSEEGRKAIKHYLYSGSSIQRNYAAMYFKRLGITMVLEEAVQAGCIDEVQAFSR